MRRRFFRKRFQSDEKCTCPNCGNEQIHQKGIPCSEISCPKCGTAMQGYMCKTN